MPQRISKSDVYHFVPNYIGYARVATAVVSLFTMESHPKFTSLVYGISCLLDAFDGYAARKYNQSTKFGAVLDMVTDRCTTASLVCYLTVLYPKFCILWQLLISLDLASHYLHMYAQLTSGASSHKVIDESQNYFLKLYYSNKTVLFTVCAFNELFFMALYLSHFDFFKLPLIHATIPQVLSVLTFPVWFFKQVTNVIQLIGASNILAESDAKERNNQSKTQ